MTGNNDKGAERAAKVKAALGIVIINYRTPALVEDCLASLGPQLEAVDARIVVVDNFSNDGSAERLAEFLRTGPLWKGRVTLLRSPTNAGFSGGNNLGIAALDAEFMLLLNSDTRVRPGALAALLDAAKRWPDAGAIGPRLEDEDGSPQVSAFRFHSPLSEFLSAAETGPFDKLLRFAVVPLAVSEAAQDCDWASFACILLRRAAIDAVGPMDEGYFMYFEDADYCRALKRAGWKTVYDPTARIVHLRGGSSPVKSAMKARKRPPAYFYAARTRYFRKWYGPFGHVAANIFWLAGRAVARVRAIAGKPAPALCERQGADQWINWRTPLGDRRAPQ